ncbi:MAG: hypothetical protein UHP27_08645 [Muribaculaceae bacterium]|nr:hypothetical protein [Muribaculaceae bacterium]
MSNAIIYTGLATMLTGAVYGLVVAIICYRRQRRQPLPAHWRFNTFSQRKPDPKMKRLVRIWYMLMALGLVLTGIGITQSL